VRTWKADVRRDLGGDLTRVLETLLKDLIFDRAPMDALEHQQLGGRSR